MQISALRIAPVLALLALAGCATTSTAPQSAAADAPTVLDNWTSRIQLQTEPDEIRLAAHPTGLSGNQARALAEFHNRWLQASGGVITIASPTNSGEQGGAYRVGTDARAFLINQGATAQGVRLIGYDAGGAAQAPVIVAFERFVAVTPTCGDWSNMTRTFGNDSYDNFGCAVSSNMAAQVANPEDLARARAMDPADPARRADVFAKYRSGAVTSSPKDAQSSATVSQAIQ